MATAGSYGGVLSYERGTPASWNQAYRQEPRERKMRKVTGRLLALYCSLEIEKRVFIMNGRQHGNRVSPSVQSLHEQDLAA